MKLTLVLLAASLEAATIGSSSSFVDLAEFNSVGYTECIPTNPAWADPFPDTCWVSWADTSVQGNGPLAGTCVDYFDAFQLTGEPLEGGWLAVRADNAVEVDINGVSVIALGGGFRIDETAFTFLDPSWLNYGPNYIHLRLWEQGPDASPSGLNYAGWVPEGPLGDDVPEPRTWQMAGIAALMVLVGWCWRLRK